MSTIPTEAIDERISCAADRLCPPDSCCCSGSTPSGQSEPTPGFGAKAAVLAGLCVVGCLAVPLAVGGAAAVGGALAGEWWLVVAFLLSAAVATAVMVRRRGR